jgi:hypothetical protein
MLGIAQLCCCMPADPSSRCKPGSDQQATARGHKAVDCAPLAELLCSPVLAPTPFVQHMIEKVRRKKGRVAASGNSQAGLNSGWERGADRGNS